jgi:hypothetical protein
LQQVLSPETHLRYATAYATAYATPESHSTDKPKEPTVIGY